jgi:nucleotide-binding universal stress UspA family protein
MRARFLIGVFPAEHLTALLSVAKQVVGAFESEVTAMYVAPEVPKRYFSLLHIPAGPSGETIENMFGVEWVAEKVFDRVRRTFTGIKVRTKYIVGDPARELIHEVESRKYDFALVGTAGAKGIQRAVLGSVSGKVAEYSPIPVLVVKRNVEIQKILVCTDGSRLAECAVKIGAHLAKRLGAELSVLSVATEEEMEDIARANVECATAIAREFGVEAKGIVKLGKVRESIIEEGEGYDLIMLGSRGLSKLQRLLMGHVSLGVLAHAETNVFIVKSCPLFE